jgi:hypothetical protein
MKLTKLDKNAHWWKGTRTTWYYQDKEGWVWLIKDRDGEEKKMKTKPEHISLRSSKHHIKFYLRVCLASFLGVFLAALVARFLL